ncbi:MAG TPA: nitrilase-related carbon-nitrogen hydrolase, partial [Acidimicrobiia bacterium]
MTVIRAALVQSEWTGDKESMVEKNLDYARKAAAEGAQILCFQEIFTTPYFCNVQDSKYYDTAEEVPGGPTVRRVIELARETGMVVIAPIYERVDEGTFYNTAAVVDADGSFLGMYRKTHIPQVEGFWEKFYFRPGNLGYPVFDTAVG